MTCAQQLNCFQTHRATTRRARARPSDDWRGGVGMGATRDARAVTHRARDGTRATATGTTEKMQSAFKRTRTTTKATTKATTARRKTTAKTTKTVTKTARARATTKATAKRATKAAKRPQSGAARTSKIKTTAAEPRKRVAAHIAAAQDGPVTVVSELPADVIEARTLRVNLSATLNKTLANDYEESRGDEPRATPRVDVSVSDILTRFTEEQAGKAKSPKSLETMRAIVRGIEDAFNDTFYASLLYKDEWHVAKAQTPSKVFGALHLLRLLAKFPDMVSPHAFASDDHAKALNVKLNELGRFIDRNAAALGVPAPPKPERTRKSAVNLDAADA